MSGEGIRTLDVRVLGREGVGVGWGKSACVSISNIVDSDHRHMLTKILISIFPCGPAGTWGGV